MSNQIEQQKQENPKKIDYFPLLLISIVFLTYILKLILPIELCNVVGNSMNPTYKDGNYLFVTKTYHTEQKAEEISRYDIVVASVTGFKTVIKRAVGLPGDTVEIKSDNGIGTVYINGEKNEDIAAYWQEDMVCDDDLLVELGENEFFLVGDNINNSSDSRSFGPVSTKEIIGYLKPKK